MSVLIYLVPSFLVVYLGSVLVVMLVVYYPIGVVWSYHFDYPHKLRDSTMLWFLFIGIRYPMVLPICHVRLLWLLFVTSTS